MSGGHYPPSYHHHIQPPPEFISPRHRLPVIPPQGPPSSTIAHAHSSPASWINKHSFSNFHDNASLYTHPIAKSYSPTARSYYNKESGWSEPVPLTNPMHRGNSNDKSRITYSNDVQQESMDLSSTHVPSTNITSPKSLNVEKSSTVPVNGSPATEHPEETPSINGSPGRKAASKMPAKKELVSVIAANPLREKTTRDSTEKPVSKNEPDKNTASKTNDTAKLKKPKNEQNIPADHVESILETMFQSSDTKSSSTTTSSVIVTTPPGKADDFRVESVEKILKSPSPIRSDNLDSDLELISQELASTKNSTTKKQKKAIDVGPVTPKNTKGNHDKSGDDSNVDTTPKTASSKKSDNQKPRKIPKKSIKIEDIRLADKCDTPAASKADKSEDANDISDIKIEPSSAEKKPKKGQTPDKKSVESNKQVPGKSKNAKEEITYVQVETELEKMFAGIEDITMDPVKSTPNDESSKPNAVQSASNSSLSQSANATETQAKPAKKKSSKKSKSPSTKKDTKKHSINSKDTSTDSVNIKRVPVIHVEGSKENPINVQIINSIKLEEDDISDAKTAAKRKGGKCDRANKRLAAGYSVKNYDPESSDESWICTFCKLSAHSPGLAGEPTGELFGPYFLQSGNDSDSKRHSRKTDHSTDPIKKKQKRSLSTDSDHTTSNSPEHKSVEIWAHENCFIWASGVHLVGSKLIGLEEAVNEASKTICAHCGEKGASIGCRTRHCKLVVHYSCALYTNWSLDLETFIAVCYLHKGSH